MSKQKNPPKPKAQEDEGPTPTQALDMVQAMLQLYIEELQRHGVSEGYVNGKAQVANACLSRLRAAIAPPAPPKVEG
jgi:hypothetical protein